jgi:two-component sensor histidine kinase
VGLPDNFSFEKSNSLGLQLIKTLTKQIDGRIHFSNNNGALFKIDFKDKEY